MMTKSILKLTDVSGCSVAYSAALYNCLPDWAKRSKDILLLGNGHGNYVVHVLAQNGNLPAESMTPDILKLTNSNGQTVLFALVSGRRLSPKILMLPWGKKACVFEYLLSKSFQKQKPNKKDIQYVKEQLATLMDLIQKKSLSGLTMSKYKHDSEEIER